MRDERGGEESLKKEKLLTQWFEFECKLQANVTVEQHVADHLRGTRRMKPWNHILLDRCMTEPLNMAVISSAPSILDTTDHDRHTHRPTVQDSSSMWFSCAEDGTAASASSVFSFSFWLYSQERNLHVPEWLSTRIHAFVLGVCVRFHSFCPSRALILWCLHRLQRPTSGRRATGSSFFGKVVMLFSRKHAHSSAVSPSDDVSGRVVRGFSWRLRTAKWLWEPPVIPLFGMGPAGAQWKM